MSLRNECRICDAIGSALVVATLVGMAYAVWSQWSQKNALAARVEALSERPASCPMIPVADTQGEREKQLVGELEKLRAAALKAINTPRLPGALRAAVEDMRALVPGAEAAALECR